MKDQLIGQQFLAIPIGALPGDPQIFIGADIPAAVTALIHLQYGATFTPIAIIKYQRDATDYWFDALVNDSTPGGFFLICRGLIGSVSNISQDWLFNLTTATTSLTLGAGQFDSSVTIGQSAVSSVKVLQDPQNRVDIGATTSVRLLKSGVEVARADATGFVVSSLVTANAGLTIGAGQPWNVDNIANGRGPRDANRSEAGNIAVSSLTTEVAVAAANWLSEPTYEFDPGALYRITLTGHCYPSAATESATTIRIRTGSASTAGNILGSWFKTIPAIGGTLGGTGDAFTLVTYATNNGGAPVNTKLSVTNQRIAGAASINLYGDATIPLRLFVEHVGAKTQNPGLNAASV